MYGNRYSMAIVLDHTTTTSLTGNFRLIPLFTLLSGKAVHMLEELLNYQIRTVGPSNLQNVIVLE